VEAAVYEPISPELVLVSPPDLATRARALLPEAPVPRWLPLAAPHRAAVSQAQLALETLGFALFCILATIGPMLLVIVART
jgi:hypothetical protein